MLLLKISGYEKRYFEKISNPQKSVCGRISTFLMSAPFQYWGYYNKDSNTTGLVASLIIVKTHHYD